MNLLSVFAFFVFILQWEVASAVCDRFQGVHEVRKGLLFSYGMTVDEQGKGTFSGKLEYEGQGWLSIAVAPNQKAKMIGAEAIIGLPEVAASRTNPGKYHMFSEEDSGVVLMADQQQTLIDAKIEQTDELTTLTFTKILDEKDEITIDPFGENTILWAWGRSNTLGEHAKDGAFSMALNPCVEVATIPDPQISEPTMKPTERPTVTQGNPTLPPTNTRPSVTEKPIGTGDDASLNLKGNTGNFKTIEMPSHKSIWAAHGFMAALAWGVMVPVAISSSFLRDMLPKTWFKLHLYLGSLALLFTTISFITAVVGRKKETVGDDKPKHFGGRHELMGLFIMIFISIQVLSGFLRPPVSKPDDDDNEETDKTKKNRARTVWEWSHRLLGLALLVMALWEVHSGLKLYASDYDTKDYSGAFLIWIALFVVCIPLVFKIYANWSSTEHLLPKVETSTTYDQTSILEGPGGSMELTI